MENEVFTPLLEQFMLTPLVCWVSSLISYSDVLSSPINHPMLFFYWLSIVSFSGEDGRTLDGDRWHQIIGIYWISGWDLPEWDNAWDVSSLRHTSIITLTRVTWLNRTHSVWWYVCILVSKRGLWVWRKVKVVLTLGGFRGVIPSWAN